MEDVKVITSNNDSEFEDIMSLYLSDGYKVKYIDAKALPGARSILWVALMSKEID